MSKKLFRKTTDYLSPADDGLRVNRPRKTNAEQIAALARELTTLRAALASAQADYVELKRVTKLLQMGNRSGRRR